MVIIIIILSNSKTAKQQLVKVFHLEQASLALIYYWKEELNSTQ